jgi:hypothetical protein
MYECMTTLLLMDSKEERKKRLRRISSHKYMQSPKAKAYQKAYQQSPKIKAYQQSPKRKAYQKAYHQSPNRKADQKAYMQSPKAKAYQKAYMQSPKAKANNKAYMQTPKGKILNAKKKSKRRDMKHELLNAWFEGCEMHHINAQQVVCIPKELHRLYTHNHKKPETMENVNRIAMQYLFNCKA